jgi:hypothetical protein
VTMQNIRRQLAQPPATFVQLARSLVPELAPGSAPNPSGATPWSRYSDRVFVRFVTTGNYATPGTYQVRVLPPSSQARAGSMFARFASFAADSDAYDVAVLASAPAPLTPSPSPSPSPSIVSETVATVPTNRERTTVDVGEAVLLTYTGGTANWDVSISNGDGRIEPKSGKTVRYYAAENEPSK